MNPRHQLDFDYQNLGNTSIQFHWQGADRYSEALRTMVEQCLAFTPDLRPTLLDLHDIIEENTRIEDSDAGNSGTANSDAGNDLSRGLRRGPLPDGSRFANWLMRDRLHHAFLHPDEDETQSDTPEGSGSNNDWTDDNSFDDDVGI